MRRKKYKIQTANFIFLTVIDDVMEVRCILYQRQV